MSAIIKVSDAPDSVWSAASDIIKYRSITRFDVKPLCKDPYSMEAIQLSPHFNWKDPVGANLHFRNCTMDIGDVTWLMNGKIGQYLQHMNKSMTFALYLENVHVVYHGGALLPAQFFSFKDCTFDFALPNMPPNNARGLTETLLAAEDIKNVEFTRVPEKG